MANINFSDLLHAERAFSTKELVDIARRVGWRHERTNGSHQIFAFHNWDSHLCLPAHKEYTWWRAKAILQEILAPIIPETAIRQSLLENVQAELMQISAQFAERVMAYETERLAAIEAELEALRQAEITAISTATPQEIASIATSPNLETVVLQQHLAQLQQRLTQQQKDLQIIHSDLNVAHQALADQQTVASERLTQIDILQRDRQNLHQSLVLNRIASTIGVALLGGITTAIVFLRPTCKPAQSHAPLLNSFLTSTERSGRTVGAFYKPN
jgi:predicted RNA binding protein YcfA (HicA-like mRNA interferase family)